MSHLFGPLNIKSVIEDRKNQFLDAHPEIRDKRLDMINKMATGFMVAQNKNILEGPRQP